MPEDRWSTYDPGTKGPEFRSRSDYGFGRVVDGPPEAPPSARPPETRSFVSRVRDEVQAWLGDRSAEERLKRDARRAGRPREDADYRDEDDIVWGGDSVSPPASSAGGGYRRPDNLIEEEVADRLTDAPEIDAGNIRVEVAGGEVRLIGHVSSDDARREAQRLAERTAGVLRVWNQLEVDAG